MHAQSNAVPATRFVQVLVQREDFPKRRPASIRALGCRLHPEAVTEAWYAAECPPRLDAKAAGLSLSVRCQWWISRCLRGVAL